VRSRHGALTCWGLLRVARRAPLLERVAHHPNSGRESRCLP